MTDQGPVDLKEDDSASVRGAGASASRVTLECRDLSKTFGGLQAVSDVSATFESGKITALVGPNGAGKTTLFHLICGALRPDSGGILLNGARIDGMKPWEVASRGVGRLFQDVRLFPKLTVSENLEVARRSRRSEEPLFALLPFWRHDRDRLRTRQAISEWLAFAGLESERDTPAEALSYGQQKLLGIARLLYADAEVLLLDEPTAGVNPILISRLLAAIRSIAEQGRTVVIIEHNMSAVLAIADWVYFLDEGQVTAFGLASEVLALPKVRKGYLGIGYQAGAASAGEAGPARPNRTAPARESGKRTNLFTNRENKLSGS